MLRPNQQLPRFNDNSINLEHWLNDHFSQFPAEKQSVIKHACQLARLTGEARATPFGEACFEQGLKIANILLELNLDCDTIAAGIVTPAAQFADLSLEDIEEHLGKEIYKLMRGVLKMNAMHNAANRNNNPSQINNLRKMILAMVADVRVVLIKLAERICVMRAIKFLQSEEAKHIAQETHDIYAPLANRLGISQMKWELEDLCFFYLSNEDYKTIAALLNEKRIERDNRIEKAKTLIQDMLDKHQIKANISGRSKHIYSIYLKMKRKNVSYAEIYDASALRIMVDTLEACYTILGAIHATWAHVPEEFDDYVSNPKPNGYQSIHTVIIGPEDKHIEVQIRTHKMHEEAELGVAAHWVYKEGKRAETSSYEEKIVRLRQLVAWHKEIAKGNNTADELHDEVFEDRVYVFTPEGDIIDLPKGATPLDFAYRIHSSIGHRCRGAKINHKIAPLNYVLNTGETVSVLTSKTGSPSRDWLNPHSGYLITSRARAKVQHWFNTQDQDHHLNVGEELLQREITRLGLRDVNLKKLSDHFHYKTNDIFLAALGKGSLKISQVLQVLEELKPPSPDVDTEFVPLHKPHKQQSQNGIMIEGVGNLLTNFAHCCKPVVGDPIVGYITQGRGVSIHRQSCNNMQHLPKNRQQRLLQVNWGTQTCNQFEVDIAIQAIDRPNLLRDITTIFSAEKINLLAINTFIKKNHAESKMTIEISDLNQLSRILEKLSQVSSVISATRVH